MGMYCIGITTVDNKDNASRIIDEVLNKKLAACIQTINIDSHYFWKDEVCNDQEILLIFKTTWSLYDDLELTIKELHPYETPEIIAVDIEKGFHGYFDWIDNVTI